jgi:hypothetical protein
MVATSTGYSPSALMQMLDPRLQGQDPFALGLELRPDDLPGEAGKLLKKHKKELGDGIDSTDELRKLMKMLDQIGGRMNGLPRPDFKNLENMSSQDLVQMLVDWITSGGMQANQQSRNAGTMRSPQNFQSRPTSWNGGGGSSPGVSSGGGSSAGTSTSTGNNGAAGPVGGGGAMRVNTPPGTQLKADAPWISQFNSQLVEDAGPVACYRACRAMMKAAGLEQPAGIGDAIQVAQGENTSGQVVTDRNATSQATNHIDEQLKAGKPVTVGVSHKDANYNEGYTDHFVVVTGKGVDENGRVFYTYQDPGSNEGQNRKFFVDDKNGNLFDDNSAFGKRFEMSMVVPSA